MRNEESFRHFISDGFVSLDGQNSPNSYFHVKMLRDTGSNLSLIVDGSIPGLGMSKLADSVIIRGIEQVEKKIPLIKLNLVSGIVKGEVRLGLIDKLPVKGVHLLIGNDLAGNVVSSLDTKKLSDIGFDMTDNTLLESNFPAVDSLATDIKAAGTYTTMPGMIMPRAEWRNHEDIVGSGGYISLSKSIYYYNQSKTLDCEVKCDCDAVDRGQIWSKTKSIASPDPRVNLGHSTVHIDHNTNENPCLYCHVGVSSRDCILDKCINVHSCDV